MTTFAAVRGHEAAVSRLAAAARDDQVAGAYLLIGPRGIGKRLLADAFAARLLCEAPVADDACGACRHCTRITAGTHPDLRIVVREPDRRDIRTEQARETTRWLGLRPLMAERKVAIVDGAEHLNEHGQNALLKTLEEPPGRAVLLLTTSAAALLLPTVRSRCQRIRLEPLGPDTLGEVLGSHGVTRDALRALAARSGGSPGRALELAADGMEDVRTRVLEALPRLAEHSAAELSRLAQDLGQSSVEVALGTAVSWYRDVLGAVLGVAGDPRNADMADTIGRAAAARPPAAVLRQLALVCDTIEALEQNANRQLALETMLLRLRAIERRPDAH